MPNPSSPGPDPYDPKPTVWQRRPHLGWMLGVFGCTAFLTFAAFPPINTGEAAYVLLLPAVLWAYRRPPFRLFALTVLAAEAAAWTALLWWLHPVTWVGLFLLGPFVGLIVGSWFLAVWWTIPRIRGHKALVRILAMLGLAALWVMLEWLRGILFGGFPWLPLAASQWQKPFLLQMAAYGGAWTVSFVLVSFNLGATAYVHRAFFEGVTGLRKRSPEFNIALLILMGSTFPFLGDIFGQRRDTVARIAIVQPYIPQEEKWDAARAADVLRTIERVTLRANERGSPEFIVWPEAVTPWALFHDPNVGTWLASVARRTGKPLLLGSVYTEMTGHPEERWYNGAFVVDPVTGVQDERYAKRKLVPFGEYIPLRPVFGWLEKFVPIGGDFERGGDARPLTVPVGIERVPVGVLICYEDIFPSLARESARAGAEMLAVLTNNAWYGEGAAAYQHAAHSVLRAVETRRPVLRCGNGGWSGWIDEFGYIRANLRNGAGSVYFRGTQTVTVTRDLRWRGRQSYYSENGDWFVVLCAVLSVGAYYLVVTLRPPPPSDGEPVY